MALVKKIILTIITSLTIVLCTPFMTQASPLAYPTERISGKDSVETALKISQKGWSSAQTVILCEYSDYPDSIASTPFAVSLNAPILMTKGDSMDPRVVKELQRLKPQNVVLLGGIACLNSSIEKELEALSLKWERIGGMDRYETSILLAKRLSSDSLILANGDDFPDALSAATFAGIKQIPVVLTSTTLPDSVIRYIKETDPKHIIVVGGEVVIPSKELTKNNFTIETRLGGQDRYDTNAKVTSSMKDTYESDDLFLASGITFPDAVAGTVLASKLKAPLLLTEQNDIPPSVYSLMREHMKIEPPAGSTSDNVNNKGIITASGGLNLRETPSSTGTLLVTIPKGTTIDLVNQQDGWYETTYQSKTGWVCADYVTLASNSTTTNLDLSINGTVHILGGTSVISAKTQTIIEGKASSNYNDNLKDFSPLPSEIKESTSPSSGSDVVTPTPASDVTPTPASDPSPVATNYDSSTEVLINPFDGIPDNSLSGKTIMVDPGHGGPDVGAVGPNNTYEKDNNLAIALTLNDILQQAGAKVILTRNNDTSPAPNYSEIEDLQARMDMANQSNADLFISIHNDSFNLDNVQGTSTYYSEDNPKLNGSQQLAKNIQSAVIDALKTNNRGLKEAGFYVLRKATMPAILLETAFISNPYEEARLQNPTFRKNVAAAIFRGIYNYYN